MLPTEANNQIFRAICRLSEVFYASLIQLVLYLVADIVTIQIHSNPEHAKKNWLAHQTISLPEIIKGLVYVRAEARLREPLHFTVGQFLLLKENNSTPTSSLLAHTKSFLSSRKENEEPESSLLSLTWREGNSTFDFSL